MTAVDRKLHTLKVLGSVRKSTVELDGVDIADCVTGRGPQLPCRPHRPHPKQVMVEASRRHLKAWAQQ